MNLRLMHLRDGVNAPRSDHRRGSDATAEPDTQPEDDEEEADTRSVIADLIEDVDADQDMPGEDEATTSAGGILKIANYALKNYHGLSSGGHEKLPWQTFSITVA
ncbi:hypothetical protein RhiLY_03513 [Ceratobasidium sp. AG-Ba]|nr:hypothetical protein RhiLY_03513 [Ceratobasidium sp. AG-Ba]